MATQNFRVKNGLEVGSNIVLNGATGIISATSVTVGGQPVGAGATVDVRTNSLVVLGVATATYFVGDGSGLTGVTATGSGIEVRDSGSVVGTAATVDFGDNLTLSAVSAGVVTVTASGGGGIAGIDTTGTSVFNQLNVSGVSTFAGITTVTGQTLFTKQLNVSGVSTFGGALISQIGNYISIMSNAGFQAFGPQGEYLALAYQTNPNYILNNVGIGTTTSLHSPSKLNVKGGTSLDTLTVSGVSTFAGIATVSGATLFAKQLNTSGIATINLLSSGLSSGLEFINPGGFGKFRLGADGGDSVGRLSWYNSSGQQMAAINGNVLDGSLDIYNYATGSQNITISAGNAVVLQHGGANTKLNTTSSGVTITGNLLVGTGVTIYGNSGIVSATTFYGNVVGNITGSITDATNLTGGTANAASLNVSGIVTISAGRIQADAASNLRFGNIAAGAGSVRNIAIGDQVLVSLSGGSGRNIGIGELSYYDTTTGQYNVGLGIQAGQKITTGSYNVILGAYDGNSGNLDIRTSSNNIIIADGQGNIRQYINSSGNVGIKTTVITEALTVAGVVSATSYSGSGIGLTGIPAGQLTGVLPVLDGSNLFGVTATGSGIQVRDDGSVVGTAATVDFGSGLSVSFGSGIATVTGGVVAGIDTVGTSGFNQLSVTGVSTLGIINVSEIRGTTNNYNIKATGALYLTGNDYTSAAFINGSTTLYKNSSVRLQTTDSGVSITGVATADQLNVIGVSTFAGITTVTGQTLFAKQLSVSGVVTASSFTGSGSGLTNIPAGQLTGTLPAIDGSALLNVTAAGTGVAVRDDNSPVGSAATINFGTGLDVTFSSGIATITASGGSLQSRTVVTGVTTAIVNNGIGNTDFAGFKSYALMKVGLSTAGWLRLYTDSASRTADASRSQGIDPSPGSGVIAEVITTGISTTQIITPFVMGGNLNSPADTTIYAAITNLSGSTQAITANLTILQLEA